MKINFNLEGKLFGYSKKNVVFITAIIISCIVLFAGIALYKDAHKPPKAPKPIPDKVFSGTVSVRESDHFTLQLPDGSLQDIAIVESTRAGRTLGSLEKLTVGKLVEVDTKDTNGTFSAQTIRIPKKEDDASTTDTSNRKPTDTSTSTDTK